MHENTPKLKDFKLLQPLFVAEGASFEENLPLSIGLPVAYNLLSFGITFCFEMGHQLSPDEWDIKSLLWIEYIYIANAPNLSVSARVMLMYWSHSITKISIATNYPQKAFCSRTQLTVFDVQIIHLSKDILQAMDDCKVCLEEIKVYVHNETDMEQLINLTHSKQAKTIQKLTTNDQVLKPCSQHHLVYFLQSLNKDSWQLKTINIAATLKTCTSVDDRTMLSSAQILDYVPSLQRLLVPCAFSIESCLTNCRQTTRLVHFHSDLSRIEDMSIMEYTQQDIQDTIYASPLLRSFFSVYCFKNPDIALDFQQKHQGKTRLVFVWRYYQDQSE